MENVSNKKVSLAIGCFMEIIVHHGKIQPITKETFYLKHFSTFPSLNLFLYFCIPLRTLFIELMV